MHLKDCKIIREKTNACKRAKLSELKSNKGKRQAQTFIQTDVQESRRSVAVKLVLILQRLNSGFDKVQA